LKTTSNAQFGKTEMAKVLIEAGGDLNFQNNDGSTALHTAAFFCRPEIVRVLLDKGADKTIKNKFGATAYQSVAGPFIDVKNS
jgi:ankyrin repeat protein